MTTRRNRRRWDVLASLVLAALLFRAYVPVGFMPATGMPFLLELCPAAGAMPPDSRMDLAMHGGMAMLMPDGHEHHHHPPGHAHFQNCPFGSAPASGPVSQLIVFQPPGRITSFVAPSLLPIRPGAQLLRAHQPRGPPRAV